MKKKISLLKSHPKNQLLYNDASPELVQELADNIKTYGQITPIVINPYNVILSGHRRVSAMRLLSKTYIECSIVDVKPDQEILYIIMANIQRQKNMVQLSNEIEMLYDLYSPGQGYRSDLKTLGSSIRKSNTREQICADLGISNKTITDLRMIREHRPDVLPYVGTSVTLSAAADQIRTHLNQEKLIADKAKNNSHISKGKRFKVYNQSSHKMKQIKDNEVDVAIFSPPYFNLRTFSGSNKEIGKEKDVEGYLTNLTEIIGEVKRCLKPTGSVFVNIADSYRDRTRLMVPERLGIRLTDELGLCVRNHICWDKGNSYTPQSTDRRRHIAWETIYWAVKDSQRYFFNGDDIRIPYETDIVVDDRPPRHHKSDMTTSTRNSMSIRHPKGKISSDVLRVNRQGPIHVLEGETKHTAPWPTDLVRELLKGVVSDDYLILDPFCGTGQTGMVAAELNCRFIGYDISQSFCRLARRRLSEIY